MKKNDISLLDSVIVPNWLYDYIIYLVLIMGVCCFVFFDSTLSVITGSLLCLYFVIVFYIRKIRKFFKYF